jgi:hypothetical protein
MPKETINPITAHELTLMPPTSQSPEPFGWIRLLNGNRDAGYIYLQTTLKPTDPHLGSKGYIVTAMPMSFLETLLDILRNEKNLQIRFFDPGSPGTSPDVFIEPAPPSQFEKSRSGINADPQVVTEIRRLLKTSDAPNKKAQRRR